MQSEISKRAEKTEAFEECQPPPLAHSTIVNVEKFSREKNSFCAIEGEIHRRERERENEILRQSLIIQEFSREFTHKSKEKKNFYFSHVNLLNSSLTLKQKFYVMRQRDFTRAEQKFILPDQGNWRRRHSVSDDDMDFGSDEEREREWEDDLMKILKYFRSSLWI